MTIFRAHLNDFWKGEIVEVYLSKEQMERFTIALFDSLCTSQKWSDLNEAAQDHFRVGVKQSISALNLPLEGFVIEPAAVVEPRHHTSVAEDSWGDSAFDYIGWGKGIK